MCAAQVNNFFCNLVECFDFSDSRVALLYGRVYKFFRINSIELKCWSFVRCRTQVLMKCIWRHRDSLLGRFTLWHIGCRATQLGRFTLWHNGRHKLHNSVNLLCGTTAAELNNPVSVMYAPGVAHIFQRQWRTMLKNMKARSKVKLRANFER